VPPVDRRTVLRSGALALGAIVVPTTIATARPRCLVVVRLNGGADGLSMVAPWRDAGCRRARPTIALEPPGRGGRAAIDLDGTVGLHPRLAPILPLFRQHALDVFPACGLPAATRSHLVDGEALDGLLVRLGAPGRATCAGPPRPLTEVLPEIAARVKEGSAPAVCVADSCGWDHHGGQRHADGPLATALDDLARGLASFARTLGPDLHQATLATVSEFGRTVRENGLGGTEHGHATAMFVLGGAARRGRVIGAWPSLGAEDAVRPAILVEDVLARFA
jgi:uncharacterized protein (DUF1501 family)